jgi:hypothetical protein
MGHWWFTLLEPESDALFSLLQRLSLSVQTVFLSYDSSGMANG